ncbi:uncharacterized protein LOC125894660 [Epinephelus fuscoguttatus]|uniref:uncharacterized protein LOC125894660 n=1 Tax=Epinephelus fuscoguttatus TaxID=293821 RepID=UPI0020D1C2EC|nr:uncharacterized protein LOC125894660 [Epinephelus fuscoguttatus]
MRELLDGHLKTAGDKDIFYNIIVVPQHNQGPRLESEVLSDKADMDVGRSSKNLQSEAGAFECSVSGLRWVCKEKVSFKYQFCSWEGHADRLKTMWYIPGGPLLDITVIFGKLDEAHLPHWICTDKELARLRPKLVERVSRELINQLLDDLLEDGVFNDGEKDSILQENSTSANRARRLIGMILKKGRKASRKLLTHLQSRDPMLWAELGLPSGPPV